jgi:type I restriction enzyme S subunit
MQMPIVKLADFIRHRKEFIRIDDFTKYTRPRVQLHWRGIIERDNLEGAAIKTKQQQVARKGELLVAEIDAKVGGIGIVPPELDGAVVSSHYFLFEIDEKKCLRKWLDYFVRSGALDDQVAARGSTNYAAIRPQHVLSFEMPLPPLTEQSRIVARIGELSAKIEEANKVRSHAVEETGAFVSSLSSYWFDVSALDVPLGDVCAVIDPNPSHRYPVYVPDGIPIVSSSEFIGEDGIDHTLAKRVPASFYEQTLGQYGVGEGDIVFSRKGKVGYARPHPKGVRLAMTHTLCVLKPNPSHLLPRYALLFARSPRFLNALTSTMNPNVGVPTLGLGVIRAARMPLPSIAEQRRVVAYLDDFQAKVDTVKKLQEESEEELNALVPSILSRAFAGEF